jgi:hypothetical protein
MFSLDTDLGEDKVGQKVANFFLLFFFSPIVKGLKTCRLLGPTF